MQAIEWSNIRDVHHPHPNPPPAGGGEGEGERLKDWRFILLITPTFILPRLGGGDFVIYGGDQIGRLGSNKFKKIDTCILSMRGLHENHIS